MRSLILVVIVACCVLAMSASQQSSSSLAAVPATGPPVLKGLSGVLVVVEVIYSDAMRDGLTTAGIQTVAEERLKEAGIRTLTENECLATPGRPYLYVRVGALRGPDGLYSYDIDLSLNEEVYLARNRSVKVSGATTWTTTGMIGLSGTVNLPQVKDSVKENVDKFCADYTAANTKNGSD